MGSYQQLAGLPLTVEGCRFDGLELAVTDRWRRLSTLIRLHGRGEEGIGEDVTYEQNDQLALQRSPVPAELSGRYTLAGFSERLDALELFPEPPTHVSSRSYRRWAFESAALDLALRQAGRSLADALERPAWPVRFVVSMGLGHPPTIEPIRRRLATHPGLRFKLDAGSAWNKTLVESLAAAAIVDVVDFKGAYKGTPVDQEADAELYERVAGGLPDVWLEDPDLSGPGAGALAGHEARITWDAPIHSVADIAALDPAPRMLNMKPSRFGRLESLCDAYDHCERNGIEMYGGGQFELGHGRGQIQLLASLFHPAAPNDVSPVGYHRPDPDPALPDGLLEPGSAVAGFRRHPII